MKSNNICKLTLKISFKEENMSEVNRNLASKYSRWGPYQYYQIIVSSVNVNQCVTGLKSYQYGYGGIAQIFLKLIAEKLVVFRGRI